MKKRARPHRRRRRRAPQRSRPPARSPTTRRSPGAGSTFVAAAGLGLDAGARLRRSATRCSTAASAQVPGSPRSRTSQVDFGASDAPLTPDQATACDDCVQIPWALSAMAIAYNVPGAPAHLRLDGATIANIFLGQITNWNDPAIAALNKGANLPNLKITPVFRSDGSGTSYALTDYLSSVNGTWKTKIGVSTQPAFPAGRAPRARAVSPGVVSRTQRRRSPTSTSRTRSRTTSGSRR